MPRPRKPTEFLELSGAFEKDPARHRPVGPKSTAPIGEPPPCFAPDEAAAWREFVRAAPAGLLTGGDRLALEAIARSWRGCAGMASPRPSWGRRPQPALAWPWWGPPEPAGGPLDELAAMGAAARGGRS